MTTKPARLSQAHVPELVQLPDPLPCDLDVTTYDHVLLPGYPVPLAEHLGHSESTIIISEIGTSLRPTMRRQGVLFPDLLIAFGVDPEARRARNGYVIEEQGKPPDFVLEVASRTTARRDETVKRDRYAAMGVGEYWRFDDTGGRFYQSGLAGDTLVGVQYQPIPIHRTEEGHLWGHSRALNIDLCWEDGKLRFWSPITRSYLETHGEVRDLRAAERARADSAEARADSAEARIRELEAERERLGRP